MLKLYSMRRSAAILTLLCCAALCAGLCSCYTGSELPEVALPSAQDITPAPAPDYPGSTFAPVPARASAEEPTAAPETPRPTQKPAFPTAYKSPDYPLGEKSRRTQEGGMYPEEKRLNSDPLKFRCTVDLVNQCAFVYERDSAGRYTVLVREMTASCGTKDHPTPIGIFTMQNDYKRFGYFVRFDCYAQYWSQVVGKIYFHSIPYLERDSRYLDVEGFYKLGSPASHGCIRLLPDDAQWVYLYLCPGTVVEITASRPYDAELRARLNLIELPIPEAYEIAEA